MHAVALWHRTRILSHYPEKVSQSLTIITTSTSCFSSASSWRVVMPQNDPDTCTRIITKKPGLKFSLPFRWTCTITVSWTLVLIKLFCLPSCSSVLGCYCDHVHCACSFSCSVPPSCNITFVPTQNTRTCPETFLTDANEAVSKRGATSFHCPDGQRQEER